MKQPSPAPTRKMAYGGLAGAATTVLIGLAKYAGHEMSLEFATALVTLVFFGVGYLVEERAP